MQIPLALLYVSVAAAPVCTAFPTRSDFSRNSSHIINAVTKSLIHIGILRERLSVAPNINLSSPSIGGITQISKDLGLLANELNFTRLLSQVQADVSSLEESVRSRALSMHCAVSDRPGGPASVVRYPDSYLILTLTKAQRYLEALLVRKENLNFC